MSRPIRASKQRAIENIKKLVAEMNAYDDNGELYITLEEVEETFAKSSYTPKILALLPTEFRNDLVEGDARIGKCFKAMSYILHGNSHLSGQTIEPIKTSISSVNDFATAYNFYRHYSEEAINYIYNLIVMFEEGWFSEAFAKIMKNN